MKLLLIPLSILLGAACSAQLGQLPHDPKAENHRLGIFGGKTVQIAKYPYTVSIVQFGQLWGAGVILNANWVLTTAFNGVILQGTTLRAGSNKWKALGQTPAIANATIHPNYTGSWANNVALLELSTPLTLGPKAKPIVLGTALPAAGTKGQVVGWGQPSTGAIVASNLLREADNAILDDTTCSTTYGTDYDASLFCTSIQQNGPCVYDFGAPLIIQNQLVGLYAGGNDCSTTPRLYANIPELAGWINSVVPA